MALGAIAFLYGPKVVYFNLGQYQERGMENV